MTGTTEGGKKASEGGRGGAQKASPVAVERYIKGIDFPAGEVELLEQARSNQAPEDVLHVIEQLPDQEYQTAVDVAKGVGQVEG